MRSSALRVLALLILPGFAGAASFTPLGYLISGDDFSLAAGVSADGGVVVGASKSSAGVSGGGFSAFRWSAQSGMEGLAGSTGVGRKVSADGTTVLLDDTYGGTSIWTMNAGVLSLGQMSDVYGTSDDGKVVVGSTADPSGYRQAARWTPVEGVVGLGSLPPGPGDNSTGWGVSGDGSVIVGESSSTLGRQAFIWRQSGGMIGLGDLDANLYSGARDASSDGSVVVGYGSDANGNQAMRWTAATGMVGLGQVRWEYAPGLFTYASNSDALAVSGDGTIIVGDTFASQLTAFIWIEGVGMQFLRDVLVARGATGLSGWWLRGVYDISADGSTVVGYGLNPQGKYEAFTANIDSVPAAVDDGPIAVIEGVAQALPVGVNDTGFTNPVTVAVTTQPTKGTITAISPPGPAAGMTVTYTANVGAAGDDSFVYEMTDSTPATDSATVTLRISQDTDGDGVVNETDNCTLTANADQRDTNGDGYGNICDPDFNNNGIVDSQDGAILKATFGSNAFPDYDLNGNGIVDSNDGARLKAKFGKAPGPSGLRP